MAAGRSCHPVSSPPQRTRGADTPQSGCARLHHSCGCSGTSSPQPSCGDTGANSLGQGTLTLRTSIASSPATSIVMETERPKPPPGAGKPCSPRIKDYLNLTREQPLRLEERPGSALGSTVPTILGTHASLIAAALATRPCTLAGTHSGGQGSVLQARCLLGSLLWALQWWGATAELSS